MLGNVLLGEMNMKTKTETICIYIYNENCVMAGHEVPQSKLANYEDPSEGSDWTGYEATAEEVAFYEKNRGSFGRKIAAALRKYI